MEITFAQFILIEKDPEMIEGVQRVIDKTGHGEVIRTIKIQDSRIVLEENTTTTRKRP